LKAALLAATNIFLIVNDEQTLQKIRYHLREGGEGPLGVGGRAMIGKETRPSRNFLTSHPSESNVLMGGLNIKKQNLPGEKS